jgi:undecaprenyl-diphosphatase
VDADVVVWFAAHRTSLLDAVAAALTTVGRGGLLLVLAAAVRGVANRRLAMAAWQVVLAVLLTMLVSDGIVKPLAQRPRPYEAIPSLTVVGEKPASEGFPSGHAATCAAAAYVLASSWPQARVGLWLFAAVVALSRVYLGVHYLTDVLAGVLVGCAVGWFVLGRTAWRATLPRSRA